MQDLHAIIPNSIRINRGKLSLQKLAEEALGFKTNKILIIDRWMGGPGKLKFYNISEGMLKLISPLLYLKNVHFRREFKFLKNRKDKKSYSLAVYKPSNLEHRKIAEALSLFLGAPLISMENKGEFDICLCILNATPNIGKLTFISCENNIEVGPSLTIKKVQWDIT
jgi:rRNA maturation protein Rpf1